MAHAQDADGDGDGVAGAEYGGADCDDQDAAVYPDASEICDDVDQDCDGSVDEWQEFAIWFPDLDGDGFGDDSGALEACRVLPDHVVTGGDCSDLDASVFPSAAEVCDGVEQNCNELVDEGLDTALWYPDSDGDGYGLDSGEIETCASPNGYVQTPGDCDDEQTQANRGRSEVYADGIDNDCSGDAPECRLLGEYGLSDATVTVTGPTDSDFGYATAFADFDGNGKDELVVGAPGRVESGIYVFADFDGSQTRYSDASLTWLSSRTAERAGGALATGEDWNGDGLPDLVVGISGQSSTRNHSVYLFAGSPDGLSELPVATISETEDFGSFGEWIFASGDHDGDGLSDFYVSTQEDGETRLLVWSGFPASDESIEDADQELYNEGIGTIFLSADITGDGLDDRFVSSDGGLSMDSGPGEGGQFLDVANFGGIIRDEASRLVSYGLASEDLDGDGYGDLIMTAYQLNSSETGYQAQALVFNGQPKNLNTSMAAANSKVELGDGYASQLILRDFDDDGTTDLAWNDTQHLKNWPSPWSRKPLYLEEELSLDRLCRRTCVGLDEDLVLDIAERGGR